MEIKTITYHKVFNLGNYSNEKIGVEIALSENDNPLEAHKKAVEFVEKAHSYMNELEKYNAAKRITNDVQNYTGRQVEQARQFIENFETNYKEYIAAYGTDVVRAIGSDLM